MDANAYSLPRRQTVSDRAELMAELRAVIAELNRAYLDFNAALEPELIESYVFQINSLQARYAWLLRSARECGLKDVQVFHFPRKENGAEKH